MPDAPEVLMQDHRKVEALFESYKADPAPTVVKQICNELTVHAAIEEEVVYPVLAELPDGLKLQQEALQEHQEVKDAIAEIERVGHDTAEADPFVQKIIEGVTHHVAEEEGELFPLMREHLGTERVTSLGEQLMAAKRQQLTAMGLLVDLTKDELLVIAQGADIEGRSSMTKDELVEALKLG